MVIRYYRLRLSFFIRLTSVLAIVIAFLLINTRIVHADTQVGGPIISNTTWTLVNSPYIVIASIDVWEGVTLTIEPGVTVKFNQGYSIQVNGELIVQGTSTQPITFTSNKPPPAPDDWGNISFTASAITTTMDTEGDYLSGSILQYCVVEYAGYNVESAIETHSMLVDHCTVRNNDARGINDIGIPASLSRITNNTVSGNTGSCIFNGGCGISTSYSTVSGNTVSGNGGGGINASDSTVSGNTVSGNDGFDSGGINASYCIVAGNTVNGNSGYLGSGGIGASYSTVTGNTVSSNTTDYGSGSGISADNSTVTGNTVNGNASMNNGGGIGASFSTVAGNTVSSNTASNLGGGIYALYNTTVISNTIIANTVSENGQGSGVYYFTDGIGTIIGNTIIGNHITTPPAQGAIIGGLAIDWGTAQVHFNNLYGNQPYDVVVLEYTTDISGTLNYWGTVNNVDILAQIYDWYDNNNRGKFLYIPYLQEPSPDAPFPPPLGLEASFQSDSVILTWEGLPSFGTGWGYKVYYDNDSSEPPFEGTGLNEGNAPINVGDQTTFTLTGLDPGKDYYFTVTAYDNTGRESWYSNVVWKQGGYWQYLPFLQKYNVY